MAGTMPLPSSWFYKLRRRGSTARGDADDAAGLTSKPRSRRAPTVATSTSSSSQTVLPPSPCSPNRASYYFPSRDRRLPPCPGNGNPKLRDTRFPRSPQPNDIVFDVSTATCGADQFDGLSAMPELKLRPILTRPAAKKVDGDEAEASDSGTSEAASPTARVRRWIHVKPSGRRKVRSADAPAAVVSRRQRRRARRRWLYDSLVVVKESADPEEDFLESMAELIAENDVGTSPRDLEELVVCYLALNDAEHHRAIVGAFRRAWLNATNAKQRLQG